MNYDEFLSEYDTSPRNKGNDLPSLRTLPPPTLPPADNIIRREGVHRNSKFANLGTLSEQQHKLNDKSSQAKRKRRSIHISGGNRVERMDVTDQDIVKKVVGQRKFLLRPSPVRAKRRILNS